MTLFDVGRLCLKIAGRDAGRKCVVVETVDGKFVMVDGNVRRKKINVKHLEPLAQKVGIKDKAGHEEVKKAFEKLGLSVWERKSKQPAERPRKQRKEKPAAKKEEKKVEEKPAERKEEGKKEEKPTEAAGEAESQEKVKEAGKEEGVEELVTTEGKEESNAEEKKE